MKTISISETEASVFDPETGSAYTLRGDQLEKHRAMFPEIDADATLRAKADALKSAKVDAVGRLVDGAVQGK